MTLEEALAEIDRLQDFLLEMVKDATSQWAKTGSGNPARWKQLLGNCEKDSDSVFAEKFEAMLDDRHRAMYVEWIRERCEEDTKRYRKYCKEQIKQLRGWIDAYKNDLKSNAE